MPKHKDTFLSINYIFAVSSLLIFAICCYILGLILSSKKLENGGRNHLRRYECYISQYHSTDGESISRLHWYCICCDDTIYSFESDDFCCELDLRQFNDSMICMTTEKYPVVKDRHKYRGYHHHHIRYVIDDYVTIEISEYSNDKSYGDAFHGDGMTHIYTYDRYGSEFNHSDIIEYCYLPELRDILIDAFIREKIRNVGGSNEPAFIGTLRNRMQSSSLHAESFAIGENGLLYSLDYNYADELPISYAERYLLEIPYKSIEWMLTPSFKSKLSL